MKTWKRWPAGPRAVSTPLPKRRAPLPRSHSTYSPSPVSISTQEDSPPKVWRTGKASSRSTKARAFSSVSRLRPTPCTRAATSLRWISVPLMATGMDPRVPQKRTSMPRPQTVSKAARAGGDSLASASRSAGKTSSTRLKRLISKISRTTGWSPHTARVPPCFFTCLEARMSTRSPTLLMYSTPEKSRTSRSPPGPQPARCGASALRKSSAVEWSMRPRGKSAMASANRFGPSCMHAPRRSIESNRRPILPSRPGLPVLPATRPEKAALGPRVRVVVVGNVAHVVVHVVLAHLGESHVVQAGPHVLEVFGRGRGAVPTPDHHGHVAYVALGDPADVVLVVPGRHALGAAEIAVVHAPALVGHGHQRSP